MKSEPAHAASDPYDVESSVKNNWNKTLGLKNFPQTSGKRFAYDVYSKKFTNGGYKIITKDFGKGSQKYVNFQGWSVLQGYKRHTSTNHETYVVARKVVGTKGVGTTKVYGTKPKGNLSATKDLEYNSQGGSGIWNECPPDATNKNNQYDCNMRYDNVGFDAYLPLDELFSDPNESASWVLFLVKRVDNHIVYTPLSMPFNFSDTSFSKGKISLTSGLNANSLQMNETSVIRRTEPRQSAAAYYNKYGKFNYFTTNKFYTRIDADEDETAVWYGVRTPEESNAKRWATSAYWTFGGNQALLSYRTQYTPPPDASCPKPVKPSPRYTYELDLEVSSIDGKTAQKNSTTKTNVEVKRKSFESDRNKARKSIEKDISDRQSKKSTMTKELSDLQKREAKIASDLEKADQTDDYSKINQLLQDLKDIRQDIANLQCFISSNQEEIDHFQKELDSFTEKETSNTSISSEVIIKYNGTQQGSSLSVELKENQVKNLTFDWKLPDDGKVMADINPSRKLILGTKESTYSNNTLETPIYIATNSTPLACAKPDTISKGEGIVRTVNSSENGKKTYKESVVTSLVLKDKVKRSGLGFAYEVLNEYKNDDPLSNGTGPKKVSSFMPTLATYLPYSASSWSSPVNSLKISGYKVPLENVDAVKGSWTLPQFYIEEYSGNIFDSKYKTNPKHNEKDKILNGGRKWYTSFEQEDGPYSFVSLSEEAGINNINTCVVGTVNINGTVIGDPDGNDDYVKRSINPTQPFPSGTGWNWKGKEGDLRGLSNWYSDWYSSPKEIPSGQYEATFKLSKETIKQIQKYNKSHNYEYQVGESVFDSISIPKVSE